jgi:hypothetical protein
MIDLNKPITFPNQQVLPKSMEVDYTKDQYIKRFENILAKSGFDPNEFLDAIVQNWNIKEEK